MNMNAIGYLNDNTEIVLHISVIEEQEKTTVCLAKESINGRGIEVIELLPELMTAQTGDAGYLFFPANCYDGCVLTRFTERVDCYYDTQMAMLPAFGMCNGQAAKFAVVSGMKMDYSLRVAVKNNCYSMTPRFILDGDDLCEDIVIEYFKMPDATYSDMGRKYREIALTRYGCVALKDRIKGNEPLAYAVDAMELRIRMGWKPCPPTELHQTPETEPPIKIVCDYDRVCNILDEMQHQGVGKAEICLVGWGQGGHDGRFPQQLPPDQHLGGVEKLEKLIQKAQSMGYQIVCHTNSVCAYTVADNWDWNSITKHKNGNGTLYPVARYLPQGLSGGIPYHVCAQTAYEQYAATDLPKIKALGFRGLHFVDELSICSPYKCYDPKHPVSRTQAGEWYRKIAQMSKKLFGGFQSEGSFDFFASDLDYAMYTAFISQTGKHRNPIFDEGIPFWQIAYHGIILSNPNSDTVNYPMQGKLQHLKFIEYGGRPLMYYYTKFKTGQVGAWLGDNDMLCDTQEQLEQSVCMLKKVYDEYEKLKHLQYEFMNSHEQISDGVFQITYSDYTVITVDYNKQTYEVTSGE